MEILILLRLSIFAGVLFTVSSQRLNIKKSTKENHFKFTNCSRSAVPLNVRSLNVSPDPIQLGEYILVDLDFSLERDVGVNHNRIEVDFSWRLKTKKGYTDLCYLVGEEACHYNDLCAVLEKYMENKKCPSFIPKMFNNNCSCPFLKGKYKIPSLPFRITQPSFGLRGTFETTVNIHEQGKYLGCLEVHFCITNCEPLGSEQFKAETDRSLAVP